MRQIVCKTIVRVSLCLGPASGARAGNDIKDYTGPFTTQALYTMCSQKNQISRDKCNIYNQSLIYGLKTQRDMQTHDMAICLLAMDVETARLRILNFIDMTTGGNPDNNKDGGDWMAFMSLAAGNTCKK